MNSAIKIRIPITDLQLAKQFFVDLLGLFEEQPWEAADPESNSFFLYRDGKSKDIHSSEFGLHFYLADNVNSPRSETMIVLPAKDSEGIYERLQGSGMIEASAYYALPFFEGFYFTDPFGNKFQIVRQFENA